MTGRGKLTIAIPTHNRVEYVAGAVASLRLQDNTSDRWAVVVVDNASSDGTGAEVGKLAADWSRLAVMDEPVPGASRARNRALEHVDSDYIVFVDDECTFPPDYIDTALRIIDERAPAMFGGPIYPWYPKPPPFWFPSDYGAYSLPWATGRSNRISLSAGNMGFEVAALRAIGGFNPQQGPKGALMAYGEETAVEQAMLAKHGPDRVWYELAFFCYHAVRPEKFDVRVLLRENLGRGRARAELERAKGDEPEAADIDVPDCLARAHIRKATLPPSGGHRSTER